MGLQLLFFGRVTIETTIFIAAFLISFAILGAIFTLFVSPYSSTFIIYFAFLILLFSSTMMAYGVTKLVGFSIFFVGAGNYTFNFSVRIYIRNASKFFILQNVPFIFSMVSCRILNYFYHPIWTSLF